MKRIVSILLPTLLLTVLLAACKGSADNGQVLPRPEGPGDVYARSGIALATAHSTTRALFKDYNGPLYQVMRQSDGKTLDIGIVQPTAKDPGGYADAAAQDRFCEDTYCWVTVIYDQSPYANHLYQAPRGGFSGPAMGGFNNLSLADWAPVTLGGHKVYGLYIAPGMGMRQNDTHGTAINDQAEGQYWVFAGNHYNDGCCFDYGNAETDSRDDGDGTMETTYYGNSTGWYRGPGEGPWIMTDQENNLVGCVNDDPRDRYCPDLPTIHWRFVTAMADGEPHHWRSMGGNAQEGDREIMYDGGRVRNDRSSYDPMRKQGAVLLGNGGDNSNGSQGTFYEGAMTVAGTFPTEEINQAVQANIVAAHYDLPLLQIAAEGRLDTPNGVQTFTPRSTQKVSVRFINTSGADIEDLVLGIKAPKGWKVDGNDRTVDYTVAQGQTVVLDFDVTSDKHFSNADLKAVATWTQNGDKVKETAVEKVRNVSPVTINEFRLSSSVSNPTDAFIELYNASDNAVDISGWSLTAHSINIPAFSAINVPANTRIQPHGHYVLGLAASGLAAAAKKGDQVIYVRQAAGFNPGDEIRIGKEVRKIVRVENPDMPRYAPTYIWQPLPDGPVITIPAGSTNVPVVSTMGFKAGDKMAIGYGGQYPAVSNSLEKYEVVTVTEVGKPGTQAWLSGDARIGDTNIKVSSTANISVGDLIRIGYDRPGDGLEVVRVTRVGTQSASRPSRGPMPLEEQGEGLDIETPLRYNHVANTPFSVNGTGISFEPAAKFDHISNEPVLPLIYVIELDKALASAHPVDAVVHKEGNALAGFQGEADQLFGGPALSVSGGNMTLRDEAGNIADVVNYGRLVDPWLSEGFHGESGHGKGGSFVKLPSMPRFRPGMEPVAGPEVFGAARVRDGLDTDDNLKDFATVSKQAESTPGRSN